MPRVHVTRISTSVGSEGFDADVLLTDHERRLVRILASGATNREIASRLGLREQTVKNRLSAIYERLGLRNRLELAVYLTKMAVSKPTRGQH